jgi:flagellar biosynthesis/type III secretory pathway protein FliH
VALIRQANAKSMARDAIVLDLGDLVAQGELLKARARAEADQILAEARTERDRLRRGAAEEGRREGLARGQEEGQKQGRETGRAEAVALHRETLAKLQESWVGALAFFDGDRDRMLLEARLDIVRIASIVAEMVTKRALHLEPDRVTDQLAAVLSLIARPTRLTVAVHPDDEPCIREALPALTTTFAAAGHAELTPDPTLERGSCVVRTATGGEIDASIRTQLRRIADTLLPEGAPPVAPDTADPPAPSSGGML